MYPESDYLLAIGKAYYAFSYYEWGVAYLVDYLGKLRDPNTCFFWGEPKLLGSAIAKALRSGIESSCDKLGETLTTDARTTHDVYVRLSRDRNHLVHAHPFTDAEHKQRLGHNEERHWSFERLAAFTTDVEMASASCGIVQDAVRRLLQTK